MTVTNRASSTKFRPTNHADIINLSMTSRNTTFSSRQTLLFDFGLSINQLKSIELHKAASLRITAKCLYCHNRGQSHFLSHKSIISIAVSEYIIILLHCPNAGQPFKQIIPLYEPSQTLSEAPNLLGSLFVTQQSSESVVWQKLAVAQNVHWDNFVKLMVFVLLSLCEVCMLLSSDKSRHMLNNTIVKN